LIPEPKFFNLKYQRLSFETGTLVTSNKCKHDDELVEDKVKDVIKMIKADFQGIHDSKTVNYVIVLEESPKCNVPYLHNDANLDTLPLALQVHNLVTLSNDQGKNSIATIDTKRTSQAQVVLSLIDENFTVVVFGNTCNPGIPPSPPMYWTSTKTFP
jgi:hypothetical protein